MKITDLPSVNSWLFWQVATDWRFYLYAKQDDRCLHLGAFDSLGNLKVQQQRFLENEKTTVLLELDCFSLEEFLVTEKASLAPRFTGILGTAWSGYSLKELDATQVELVYAADLRHEWLGVFTEAEAFAAIEQHYDRRRHQCLLC